jgi:hypothetical protein
LRLRPGMISEVNYEIKRFYFVQRGDMI